MLKVASQVLAASVVCFALLAASTGAYGFDTPSRVGQSIGALLMIVTVGLVAAVIARMIRGRHEGVMTMSGITVIVAFSLMSYAGLASH